MISLLKGLNFNFRQFKNLCFILLYPLTIVSPNLYAESVTDMLYSLEEIKADPTAYETALKLGEERALLCGYCHGKDGNSVKNYIPNLADQNEKYLLVQFERFAEGTRQNYVMEKLAENMDYRDKINLALYYASLKVKTDKKTHLNTSLNQPLKTTKTYQAKCALCHGQDGKGNEHLPRIAGQPQEFLTATLLAFKTKESKRTESPMDAVVNQVTKDELKELAKLISSM